MNMFLNQAGKFWQQLGIGQKISMLISLLAVGTGVALLVYWASRPQFQLLYGGLEQKEMAEVISSLEEQNVPYQLSGGGRSIMVPHNKVYGLRMHLAEKGLPAGGGVGYEIFDRNHFGVSDFMQKTNYIRALQGELSRTICEVNGIRNAKVMIVMPENKLLSAQANIKPTASVFVDVGGQSLSESAVNSVRFLVANAVEGLKLDDVSVIDNHGKVLSEDLQSSGAMGAATSQLRIRENLENYFCKKIESMLNSVVGEGNVVARVSVDLETSTTTFVEEKFDPESQVVRSQTYVENTSLSNESNPNLAVGVEANDTSRTNKDSKGNKEASSRETKKNRAVSYDINKSTKEIVVGPGTIKKVTASVFVGLRYSDEAKKQANPRSDEELKTLKSVIANALGIEDISRVSVQEVAFSANKTIATEARSSFSDFVMQWMGLIKNFVAIGVSILLFLFFLKMVKATKPDSATSFELMEMPDYNKANGNGGTFLQPSPEMLNDLIRQKPENVSVALKEWAGEVKG